MAQVFPVTEGEKDEIVRAYEDCLSLRQTASTVGRSVSTVRRVLNARGIQTWRQQTHEATEVAKTKANQRRLSLVADMLDDIDVMRERLTDRYSLVTNGPDGVEIIQLDEPPSESVQAFAKLINSHLAAVDKILENANDGSGLSHAKSVLGRFAEGLDRLLERDPTAGLGPRDQDGNYDVKEHLDN